MSRKAGKWHGGRQGDLEADFAAIDNTTTDNAQTNEASGSADIPLWLIFLIVWIILR